MIRSKHLVAALFFRLIALLLLLLLGGSRADAAPVNLAAAPVDSSSFAAEYAPGLMFDGDDITRYVGTAPTDWIRVDLGQEYFLNHVEIRFTPSCATAMSISVLGTAGAWDKNEQYTPVWSIGPVSSGSYLSSTDNGKDYADPTVLNVNFRTQSVSANVSNHAALHKNTVTPAARPRGRYLLLQGKEAMWAGAFSIYEMKVDGDPVSQVPLARTVVPVINGALDREGGGWWASKGFVWNGSTGHNAPGALVYEKTTTGSYTSTGYSMDATTCKPGSAYDFSIWVKSDKLSNPRSSVMGIECYNAQGKFTFSKYISLASVPDWQKVSSGACTIPLTTTTTVLVLFLGADVTGTATIDDFALHLCPPLWQANLLFPYQERLANSGSTLTLSSVTDGEVAMGTPPMGALSLRTSLIGGDGLVKHTVTGPINNERATITLPGGLAADIGASLRVELIEATNGWRLQETTFPVRIVAPETVIPTNGVWLDAAGRTVINGTPFLPLVIYGSWSCWAEGAVLPTADLDLIEDSPFNTILPYDSAYLRLPGSTLTGIPRLREVLDELQRRHLKLLFAIGPRRPTWEGISGESAIITAIVIGIKDHPALLGYYLADEPQAAADASVAANRSLITALDPSHPVVNVYEDIYSDSRPRISRRPKIGDVAMVDPYPIGDASVQDMGMVDLAMKELRRGYGTAAGASGWFTVQAHNLGLYYPGKLRSPTEEEMRSMMLRAVNYGAKGFATYAFFDLRRDPTASFADRWQALKNAVQPIKELAPFILSATAPVTIASSHPAVLATKLTDATGAARVVVTGKGPGPIAADLMLPNPAFTSAYGRLTISGGQWRYAGADITSDVLIPATQ